MPNKVSHSPLPPSSAGTVPPQFIDRAAIAVRLCRLAEVNKLLDQNKDAIRIYRDRLFEVSADADEKHPWMYGMLVEARRHRAVLLKERRVLVRAIGRPLSPETLRQARRLERLRVVSHLLQLEENYIRIAITYLRDKPFLPDLHVAGFQRNLRAALAKRRDLRFERRVLLRERDDFCFGYSV